MYMKNIMQTGKPKRLVSFVTIAIKVRKLVFARVQQLQLASQGLSANGCRVNHPLQRLIQLNVFL